MGCKDLVLALLERSRGQRISGATIAQQLGVSRSAVWKAVRELENEGYRISAVTNGGYCLDTNNDILSAQGMAPFLAEDVEAAGIFVFDSVESTNRTAKEMAMSGGKHGTVIVADRQTAGRGRRGRSFYSPPGCGVYMSLILRPERLWVETHTLITALAAVAVCETVEECVGLAPGIKWVNDVFLKDRKICGILTEAVSDFESGGIQWIVAGIGVNVSTVDFPEDLRSIAGSVAGGVSGLRNRIAAGIVNRMVSESYRVTQDEVLERYRRRMFMLGREVTVTGLGDAYPAVAESIDDAGRLIVRRDDDTVSALQAGEISIR